MGIAQYEKIQSDERKFKRLSGRVDLRTTNFCKNTGHAADILGIKRLYIESARYELLHPQKWMKQAKRNNANTEAIPCIFFSRSPKPWYAIPPAIDFLQVYKEDNGEKITKPTGIDINFGNSM